MRPIKYDVRIPVLTGMTEAQRCRALEDYMRESQRQLRLILQAQGLINEDDTAVGRAQKAADAAAQAAAAAQKTADAAATPEDVAEAISESEAREKDYVIETGKSGIWTWEKWAGGKAVCRGVYAHRINSGGLLTAGNVYTRGTTAAFPTGLFASLDNIQISPGDSSESNSYWTGHYSNSTPTEAHFQVFRGAQLATAVTFNINIYAVGRWQAEEE